jgi:hypothetical protein
MPRLRCVIDRAWRSTAGHSWRLPPAWRAVQGPRPAGRWCGLLLLRRRDAKAPRAQAWPSPCFALWRVRVWLSPRRLTYTGKRPIVLWRDAVTTLWGIAAFGNCCSCAPGSRFRARACLDLIWFDGWENGRLIWTVFPLLAFGVATHSSKKVWLISTLDCTKIQTFHEALGSALKDESRASSPIPIAQSLQSQCTDKTRAEKGVKNKIRP